MEAILVMMLETALKPPALSLSARTTLILSCSSPSPCGSKVIFPLLVQGQKKNRLEHNFGLLIFDLVGASQLFKAALTMFKLPLEGEQDRSHLILVNGGGRVLIVCRHYCEGVQLSPGPPTPSPWLPSSLRTQSTLPPEQGHLN